MSRALERVRAASGDLDRLIAAAAGLAENPNAPALMAALRESLTRAACALDELSKTPDDADSAAYAEHRRRLERLQLLLRNLESELVERRVHLKAEEARLTAARSWAQRCRETLG